MVKDEITTLLNLRYTAQEKTQQNKKTRAARDEISVLLSQRYLTVGSHQGAAKTNTKPVRE